jgi:molybdenum cofactor cytidylyltransferase
MDLDDARALHAAILAAGPSTRFGTPGQLARLDGGLVLHRTVATASSVAGHSVSVVIGADAREVAPTLRQSSASIVVNRDWAEGLASSIRAAVRGTPPRCEGLLLMLADQVCVTADDIRRLFVAWRRQPTLISAALHGGAPGLPSIFPRWAFSDLMELRGDLDPGRILRRHPDRVVRIPMASAALAPDTAPEPRALAPAAVRTADALLRPGYHSAPSDPGN